MSLRTRVALIVAVLGLAAVATVAAWQLWRSAPVVPAGLAPPAAAAGPSSPPGAPSQLLAAGDIADCGGGAAATAALLRRHDGVVAPIGDLAYPEGSASSFQRCYDPTWGPFRTRTRPAQGNHDVLTAGAGGYYGFFGSLAGPDPQGYYSYDLGAWHVVVLNSNCAQVGGCGPGSPQVGWLHEDLGHTTTGNILAYWHHPRFSTGMHGDDGAMATFWRVLSDAGADVVLNGHDHDYERFVPLASDGSPAPNGIREFVVGTGGAPLRAFTAPWRATDAYRQHDQHGILQLDLRACGYSWAFLPASGDAPLDRGQANGTC